MSLIRQMASDMRPHSLEAKLQLTEEGQRAMRMRLEVVEKGLHGSSAWALLQQAMELEELAADKVLSSCQVVACTCIGAGDVRVASRSFPL